ncbi:alpha-ketoglutarate-dependent dioxygenase AlkB [Nocardioides sp. W7]|uniref:alpha-ketoglutarate-dependent dioxygenase AlkB n=1 Tax=Nocardioides sp. W7 TaxID=2931390 RepID=UPI001FD3FD56|nr:alpha-ketoglutarate-dependent dioxygenase AlkB [Nocardioides sp. W7]
MTDALDVVDVVDGIQYFPGVVDADLVAQVRNALMRADQHAECEIIVDGERHPAPRLVSSFSDVPLGLDGMDVSRVWSDELADLRDVVAKRFGLSFNYALANLYRDGEDHTGWHSDKASLHVDDSKIAIVSFGAPRTLSVRSYAAPTDVRSVVMEEGAVVVMDLAVQATHEHTVVREEATVGPRLSLTLREIRIFDEYLVDEPQL